MKESSYNSDKHKRFIESLKCIIYHNGECEGDVICHHVGGLKWFGTIKKHNDYLTVPLCMKHHRYVHDIGQNSFGDEYFICWEWEIIRCLMERLRGLEDGINGSRPRY